MKRTAALCISLLLFPYLFTLAWTGRAEGMIQMESSAVEQRMVILDRGGNAYPVPVEDYIIGMAAMQIPADYEKETIKAQMIIARTYLYSLMGEESSIPESAIDADIMTEKEMRKTWGKESFLDCCQTFADAARETRGTVAAFEGTAIAPLFHRISAGKTRKGDALHPYLASVDCGRDVEAEGYLTSVIFTPEEFCRRLNEMDHSLQLTPKEAYQSLQIVERDESGYVIQMKVGERIYTGEEIQYALGLKSAAFSFEEMGENIRCLVRGEGHGYGFDQWGANEKAKEGAAAEELLKYYYKNIELISE